MSGYSESGSAAKHFDQGKLEELAQSIKVNGLLEPIIVVGAVRNT